MSRKRELTAREYYKPRVTFLRKEAARYMSLEAGATGEKQYWLPDICGLMLDVLDKQLQWVDNQIEILEAEEEANAENEEATNG